MTAMLLAVGAILIGAGLVVAVTGASVVGAIVLLVAGVAAFAWALSRPDVPNQGVNEPFQGRESTRKTRVPPRHK